MKNAHTPKSASALEPRRYSTASAPRPDLKSARNPRPGTQAFRLLAELQAGNRVDPLQGWFRLGIYRLSDTVLQLRKAGWQVITDTKEVNNRYGEVCRVASYRLPALDARSTKEAS